MELRSLFQWCDFCKTETVFDYETVRCLGCKNRPLNYKPKEEKNVTDTTNKGKDKEPGLEGT